VDIEYALFPTQKSGGLTQRKQGWRKKSRHPGRQYRGGRKGFGKLYAPGEKNDFAFNDKLWALARRGKKNSWLMNCRSSRGEEKKKRGSIIDRRSSWVSGYLLTSRDWKEKGGEICAWGFGGGKGGKKNGTTRSLSQQQRRGVVLFPLFQDEEGERKNGTANASLRTREEKKLVRNPLAIRAIYIAVGKEEIPGNFCRGKRDNFSC